MENNGDKKNVTTEEETKQKEHIKACLRNFTAADILLCLCIVMVVVCVIFMVLSDNPKVRTLMSLSIVTLILLHTLSYIQKRITLKLDYPCLGTQVFPDFPFNFSNKVHCVLSSVYTVISTIIVFILNTSQVLIILNIFYLVFRSFIFYSSKLAELPQVMHILFNGFVVLGAIVGCVFYFHMVFKKRSLRIFKNLGLSIFIGILMFFVVTLYSLFIIETIDNNIFLPRLFIAGRILPILDPTMKLKEISLGEEHNLYFYSIIVVSILIISIIYACIFIKPTGVYEECINSQTADKVTRDTPYQALRKKLQIGTQLTGICLIFAFILIIIYKQLHAKFRVDVT